MKTLALLLVCAVCLIQSSQCYRILFLAPFPAPSHWMWLRHFSQELIRRGHEVSVESAFITFCYRVMPILFLFPSSTIGTNPSLSFWDVLGNSDHQFPGKTSA